MNKIDLAKIVCKVAHDASGQKRKYIGDPYWTHPFRVADIVSKVGGDEDMIIAAYLHDVVEDTEVSISLISEMFGKDVAMLVDGLTDKSKLSDGNRAVRKKIDRDNLNTQCNRVKTIKLADLIDNTSSITKYDKDFSKVYMKEKSLMLDVLNGGNEVLWKMAKEIVDDYCSNT